MQKDKRNFLVSISELTQVSIILGPAVDSIEREGRIARDGELGHSEGIHLIDSCVLVLALGQLLEALSDVERHVNQCAVTLAL